MINVKFSINFQRIKDQTKNRLSTIGKNDITIKELKKFKKIIAVEPGFAEYGKKSSFGQVFWVARHRCSPLRFSIIENKMASRCVVKLEAFRLQKRDDNFWSYTREFWHERGQAWQKKFQYR
ncbi:MAG: hypothetical protein A3B08_02020 [Candidatus Taylorbacteria bacterium RIFCSPLOWO2_01_FULL_43_44]|nr:MAG: hypothetical protein A3B08_02020 [Candidatus Taylorbacteria bacterium RIFCSPLOWO2_01_FULL_43_44]